MSGDHAIEPDEPPGAPSAMRGRCLGEPANVAAVDDDPFFAVDPFELEEDHHAQEYQDAVGHRSDTEGNVHDGPGDVLG